MKNLENKIGRDDDPLFNHPYFQIKIKTKEEEFERNSLQKFKAHYEPVVGSTATGSTNLNKSMAHSGERDVDSKIYKPPTSENLKFKNLSKRTNLTVPAASILNKSTTQSKERAEGLKF